MRGDGPPMRQRTPAAQRNLPNPDIEAEYARGARQTGHRGLRSGGYQPAPDLLIEYLGGWGGGGGGGGGMCVGEVVGGVGGGRGWVWVVGFVRNSRPDFLRSPVTRIPILENAGRPANSRYANTWGLAGWRSPYSKDGAFWYF